ncbi:MAG: RHS repeat-associated core domain-containing protein [Fimbriimonadaceae bacterium]|jgi:RHS repeat-associated protein|nr:RHS repeat-associated core domain-containing protein [Fimbriimonadaceae bacterium]
MVATLSKIAAGTSWHTGNQRSYDVWGGVRSGSATGGPKQRYCANLGHVHDDESGLIYMRARYYEPASGRFISEDPARYGHNWFVYCMNDGLNYNDETGNSRNLAAIGAALGFALFFTFLFFKDTDGSSETLFRFVVAGLIGSGVAFAGPYVEPWILRATKRVAAIQRLDQMKHPNHPSINLRYSRAHVQVAFYAGYSMFLAMMMEYLQDWATGEA